MERRAALKQMLIIAGGIALLPSCATEPGKSSIQLTNLDITADQEALLLEIAATILPKTDGPGARELNLHLFTLKMVDDCHTKEDQEAFVKGLHHFDQLAKDTYKQSFIKCTPAERTQLLMAILKDEHTPKPVQQFLQISKHRIIQGFNNSKYVMSDLHRYELVPGRYNGYFPVKEA
jgi:hypothetical protein